MGDGQGKGGEVEGLSGGQREAMGEAEGGRAVITSATLRIGEGRRFALANLSGRALLCSPSLSPTPCLSSPLALPGAQGLPASQAPLSLIYTRNRPCALEDLRAGRASFQALLKPPITLPPSLPSHFPLWCLVAPMATWVPHLTSPLSLRTLRLPDSAQLHIHCLTHSSPIALTPPSPNSSTYSFCSAFGLHGGS